MVVTGAGTAHARVRGTHAAAIPAGAAAGRVPWPTAFWWFLPFLEFSFFSKGLEGVLILHVPRKDYVSNFHIISTVCHPMTSFPGLDSPESYSNFLSPRGMGIG